MSFPPSVFLLFVALSWPAAHRALPAGHPESMSRSRVLVQGSAVTVELQFQSLSLIEVVPELDTEHDGAFDAAELEAARPAIEAYLLEHFRVLRVDGEVEAPLAGKVTSLAVQDAEKLGPFELQNLSARMELAGERPIETLVVECVLFHETNPWHRDLSSLVWNDADAVPHVFEGSEVRWRFEPAHVRRPGVLAHFAGLGARHALAGDHLAFLLALFVVARGWKGLVGAVLVFAAANAIALPLAADGRIVLPPRLIELASALAIAYVACDNLLRSEARDPWLEAGLFGLLHGLGYALYLMDPMAGEPLFTEALVGFGLGLALVQLGVALVGALLAALGARRWRGQPGAGLVPRTVRSAASIVVALLGFVWFVQRAGWI